MTKVAKPVASPLQTENPFIRKTIYLFIFVIFGEKFGEKSGEIGRNLPISPHFSPARFEALIVV